MPLRDAVGRWVLPPALAAGTGPSTHICARVGTLGSDLAPAVDGRGLVVPDGAGGTWSLDWWVGADDRWHLAAEEPAVRQVPVGGAPVIQTRLRIPNGDAVHRVFGFIGRHGGEMLAVEVENDSSMPFVLALAVRPFTADGAGAIRRIAMEAIPGGRGREAARAVAVDGVPRLLFGTVPARSALCVDGTDVVSQVTTGGAPTDLPTGDAGDRGLATAAFLFPVPHRTAFRALLPLGPQPNGSARWTAAIPDAGQVARGWSVQADRGARLDLPDPWDDDLPPLRRQLLLLEPGLDLVPAFLQLGYRDVAEECLTSALSRAGAEPGALLAALAAHWRLAHDRGLIDASRGAVEHAVRDLSRATAGAARNRQEPSEATRDAFSHAANVFDVLGDRRAAHDCRRLGDRSVNQLPRPAGEAEEAETSSDARARGPVWPFTCGRSEVAGLLNTLRASLVDDDRAGVVDLLPGWRLGWAGRSIDVADLPTAAGTLSYSVRWHGDRPALLWELQTPDGSGPPRLTASALGRSWSTGERSGEALLDVVPPSLAAADR